MNNTNSSRPSAENPGFLPEKRPIRLLHSRAGVLFAACIAVAAVVFSAGKAQGQITQTFTTPGNATWQCPAGVTSVQVQSWGGGGGGGGTSGIYDGAGGGAGGSYVSYTMSVTPGSTYQYTVGAGGTSGAAAAGGAGGSSYFGNSVAGNSSDAVVLAVGGAGGPLDSISGTNSTHYNTTAGATASNAGNLPASGATNNTAGTDGGTGPGTTKGAGGGGAGAGASGSSGGGAGGGGASSAGNGTAGTAPGGGGGGGDNGSTAGTSSGGAGGAGQIALTYTASTPVINTSGTAYEVFTTQGTASAPTSFSASGQNLTANIIITPPTGFEVSTTSSTSGYASSGTLAPSSGTVNATTVYVRLAAATAAGTYSGNVALASTGAATVNVAIPTSLVAAPFTQGNVIVQQADNGSLQNTTATMLEINSSATTTQANPVQTIPLPGFNFNSTPTQSQALRINGSGGTTGYLATTQDGTLLAVVDANALSSSDISQTTAASILNRAVVTLGASGNITFPAYYTGVSGNQARAATSLDDITWFVADKGGIYTTSAASPATSPDSTTNMLVSKSFGGQVYGFSATAPGVTSVTTSGAGIGSLNSLPNLSVSSDTDFYLISSGVNGAAFDVCYVCNGATTTSGTISKFSLVNGSWVASGTYTTNFGGRSIVAAGSGSGAVLYLTGGDGGHSGVSVMKLADTAPWNSTINITTGSNVALYTFASGASGPVAKGIAFAPTSTALPDLTIAASVPVTSSSAFNYTLTVANSGAANATGVTAQFTLPTGLTYVSATDNGGNGFTASNNNGVITFTGGALNSGSSDTITVAVTGALDTTYTVDSGTSPATGHGFATINTSASTATPIAESNTTNNCSAVSAATTTVSASISASGTPVALSTTYGTASTPTSFSVSGSGLTANITVTAPAGFQVSTSSGSGYASSLTLTQSGGSVASTTIYVCLAATTGAGNYSGNVALASTGAPAQNVAIPSSTVSPLALTVSGAAVTTKPWDGTTAATITGTLVGVVNGDTVTLVGTGNFASSNDGTWSVTSTSSLGGAGAVNYTLTQPTGMTGTILPSANLGGLTLSAGSLTTPFAFNTTSYSVYLPGNTSSLTLTPTADTGATVTVNGSSASTPVSLSAGSNTITVIVTPNGGGSTQTYTLNAFVAGPFTQGDLVVTVYGNTTPGTIHPDNAPTLITLEEFAPALTTNASPVMAVVLPSAVSGNNVGAVGEFGSSSEGTIQLTDDGQHLTEGAYSAVPGLAYTATALAQSPDTSVPRVAAFIDVNGNVDTSSVFNDIYNTNNPRCVYSPDDISLYLSGQGAGASDEGGIYYTHLGTNTTTGGAAPTGIFNVVSTRTLFSYQGNLYYSADQNSASKGTQTGIFEYSGEPTTSQSTNTGTRITPANDGGSVNYSPDGFFFANTTTLYVADTGDPKAGGTGDGGIQKWVYNGTQWVLQYTLTNPNFVSPSLATTAAHGETGCATLTGTVVSGTAYLYTTSYTAGDADPDGLYGIADTVSSTTGAGETLTEIAAAPGIQSSGSNPDYVFKGVSFAPIAAPASNTASSNVSSTGASLGGSLNPGGTDMQVYIQYGTTTAYGQTSGTTDLGSGNSPVAFNFNLTGLQPGTTYDYRLVSDPAGTTTYYANETFTTPAQVPAMPAWGLAGLAAALIGFAARSFKRKKRDASC